MSARAGTLHCTSDGLFMPPREVEDRHQFTPGQIITLSGEPCPRSLRGALEWVLRTDLGGPRFLVTPREPHVTGHIAAITWPTYPDMARTP